MPQPPNAVNAVIAGSKSFVAALQPQLQLRLGAAPEVVPDPAAALHACARRGGLLVFEHGAPEWAEALRSLRGRQGPVAVAVIAAVADLASAAQPIDGVDEVVPWQGRPDPVMWAVERVVARARAGVAPPRSHRAQAATESAPEPAAAPLVDIYELGGTDAAAVSVVLDSETAAPIAWPNTVPALEEAQLLLTRAVAGELPPGDAGGRIGEFVATLSRLERTALAGALADIEPAALIEAAAHRFRVAEALATAPSAPAAIDGGAAERLLGDVDAVLGRVKALADSGGSGLDAELDLVRRALVSAGVELSVVVSSLGSVADEPSAAAAPSVSARVLSNSGEGAKADAPRSRRGLLVALGVVLAATLAFRVRHAYDRPVAREATLPGAPANTFGGANGSTGILKAIPGRKIDPAELSRFIAAEQAKGNDVRQVGATTWIVSPRANSDTNAAGRSP